MYIFRVHIYKSLESAGVYVDAYVCESMHMYMYVYICVCVCVCVHTCVFCRAPNILCVCARASVSARLRAVALAMTGAGNPIQPSTAALPRGRREHHR